METTTCRVHCLSAVLWAMLCWKVCYQDDLIWTGRVPWQCKLLSLWMCKGVAPSIIFFLIDCCITACHFVRVNDMFRLSELAIFLIWSYYRWPYLMCQTFGLVVAETLSGCYGGVCKNAWVWHYLSQQQTRQLVMHFEFCYIWHWGWTNEFALSLLTCVMMLSWQIS